MSEPAPEPQQPHITLQRHPGFQRLFRPGRLTVGLILPLETHPDRSAPTMQDHLQMAQRADELGFGALWLRDVPFYDPEYNDVAHVFETMIYLGYLAAATQRISLGTTGIVLPTHEPMYLAKQAASLDQLSAGRLVLGLSSGDRESDYPMLDIDFATRGERYRDAYRVFRTLTEEHFPSFRSARFGGSRGTLDLVPKPCMVECHPSLSVDLSRMWNGLHTTWMVISASFRRRVGSKIWRWTGRPRCGRLLVRRSSNRWAWAVFSTLATILINHSSAYLEAFGLVVTVCWFILSRPGRQARPTSHSTPRSAASPMPKFLMSWQSTCCRSSRRMTDAHELHHGASGESKTAIGSEKNYPPCG